MGASELEAWVEFAQHEPLGPLRGDVQTAMVMAMLANINRDEKKRRQPFEVGEFVPDWWQDHRPTESSVADKVRAMFGGLNG